ncbi:Prophage integrase [Klebsiella quasipneumoniae subsp. similipneumoniae]|nr:phage integrase [Klebsiella pneumoniae]
MARIVTKLNDTQIKKAKATDDNKEITLYDGDGLMLRVKPSGKKIWYFNYQVPVTKKRTKTKLGNYPHLTLARAELCVMNTYLYLQTASTHRFIMKKWLMT